MRAIRHFVDNDVGFAVYGSGYIGQYEKCGLRRQSNKMQDGTFALYRSFTGNMMILYRKCGKHSQFRSFDMCKTDWIQFTRANNLVPLNSWESHRFKPLIAQAAREAIHEWTLCARQLGVLRDLRIHIAKLVWERRHLFMLQ